MIRVVAEWFTHNWAFGGLAGFFSLGILWDITAMGKKSREVIKERWRRLLAYGSAIMIAALLDQIVIGLASMMLGHDLTGISTGEALGWQLQTRFLVTLYLAGREALKLLEYIAGEGIEIPILRKRLKKMMELEATDESAAEVKRLLSELRAMREERQPGASANGSPNHDDDRS